MWNDTEKYGKVWHNNDIIMAIMEYDGIRCSLTGYVKTWGIVPDILCIMLYSTLSFIKV